MGKPQHEVLTFATNNKDNNPNNDKAPTWTGKASGGSGSFVPKRLNSMDELQQEIQNIEQLQNYATQYSLAPSLAAFVNYGAEDEESLLANRQGFDEYYLRPQILQDVATVDTSTTILQGRAKLSMPIGIAPFAGCRCLHEDGEKAVASAASLAGTIYSIPNWASQKLLTILDCHKSARLDSTAIPPLFFQVYPHKPIHPSKEGIHRQHMKALLEYLSETAGTDRIVAIVVTCDTPNNGNREKTYKNPRWLTAVQEEVGGFPMPCCLEDAINLPVVKEEGHSAQMTWDDIRWMKEECATHDMALIVKGVMTWEDAIMASAIGCDAIMISNHGGRQCDGTKGTIEIVEECVEALSSRSNNTKMEIYVDGGIRRGKDIVKCLALGAKCCFVGRPILWGLAAGGQKGVEHSLHILKNELREVMQLLGCSNLNEITRRHVGRRGRLEGLPDSWRPSSLPKSQKNSAPPFGGFVTATAVVCIATAFALGRSSSSFFSVRRS